MIKSGRLLFAAKIPRKFREKPQNVKNFKKLVIFGPKAISSLYISFFYGFLFYGCFGKSVIFRSKRRWNLKK